MKITAIEPVVCALPLRPGAALPAKLGDHADMMLVRVRTDEGLVGWGEVFALGEAWKTARVALQTTVAPRLIGRDPRQIQALSRELLHHIHQLGRSGPVMHAWSGVETALWDLLGKSLGVPLHVLLGGAQVERLSVYASLPRYGSHEPVLARSLQALREGYRGVKLHEIDPAFIRPSAQEIAAAGAETMVDANAAWTLPQALEIVRELRELRDVDMRWLEEPLKPADDYEAYVRLKAQCPFPLAAGESASAPGDFRVAQGLQALDVLQPSVAKIGGVGGARRVFELAGDTALEVAPHTPLYGPALLASLHLCAALAPRAWLEHFYVDLACSPFAPAVTPVDGHFMVPMLPGLGSDPDEDILRRCRIE